MYDEVFKGSIARNNGEFINQVPVDYGPDQEKVKRVYLTTGRFGNTLVGFASHRDVNDTPVKNATRIALCHQNKGLDSDLFGTCEKFADRERFVIVMVQRDPLDIGKIQSISVGLVNAKAEEFIVLENMNDFLAGYGSSATEVKRSISLRPVAATFKETVSG